MRVVAEHKEVQQVAWERWEQPGTPRMSWHRRDRRGPRQGQIMRRTRYQVCEPPRKGCWPILRLRAKGGERPQVSGMWQKRGKCCSASPSETCNLRTSPGRRPASKKPAPAAGQPAHARGCPRPAGAARRLVLIDVTERKNMRVLILERRTPLERHVEVNKLRQRAGLAHQQKRNKRSRTHATARCEG